MPDRSAPHGNVRDPAATGAGTAGAHADDPPASAAHDDGDDGPLAPTTFDDLVAVLHRRLPTLTPSQRLLAERVMTDAEGIAFMTVGELAAAVGVNESTVVRFATSLGLDGYPGLTRLCRDLLRAEAQLVRRFASVEELTAPGTADDPLDRANRDPLELTAAFDQANIARTFARVDRRHWSAAVAALASAPRVHVLGLRKCHAAAFLLTYLLRMVRDDVELLGAAAGTLVDELRRVRPGDAFVGLSIHRYSRDTVRAFRRAGLTGATTIALTDNASSPLAAEADHPFYVDTTGVAVLRSVTAFTAVVQALANAVAAERGARTRAVLSHEEELLDEFQVYEHRLRSDDPPATGRRRPPGSKKPGI